MDSRRRDAADRRLRRLPRSSCTQFVYHSGLLMKPVFAAAKQAPKRIVYAEGEDERVLRAVQVVVDEGLAQPILIGRPAVIAQRIERFGLRLTAGRDFELVNPGARPALPRLLDRVPPARPSARGVSQALRADRDAPPPHADRRDAAAPRRGRRHALRHLRHASTLHLHYIDQVIGLRAGVQHLRGDERADAARRARCSSPTPTSTPTRRAEQLAEITLLAAEEMRRFGITPKVALLSHSSFGTQRPARRRARCARRWRCIKRARPSSRSTARCTATPRSPRTCAQRAFPELAAEGRGQPADHARRSTPPTSPSTC